jgi:hypothetical protein
MYSLAHRWPEELLDWEVIAQTCARIDVSHFQQIRNDRSLFYDLVGPSTWAEEFEGVWMAVNEAASRGLWSSFDPDTGAHAIPSALSVSLATPNALLPRS